MRFGVNAAQSLAGAVLARNIVKAHWAKAKDVYENEREVALFDKILITAGYVNDSEDIRGQAETGISDNEVKRSFDLFVYYLAVGFGPASAKLTCSVIYYQLYVS